jgi:hypothetical protein
MIAPRRSEPRTRKTKKKKIKKKTKRKSKRKPAVRGASLRQAAADLLARFNAVEGMVADAELRKAPQDVRIMAAALELRRLATSFAHEVQSLAFEMASDLPASDGAVRAAIAAVRGATSTQDAHAEWIMLKHARVMQLALTSLRVTERVREFDLVLARLDGQSGGAPLGLLAKVVAAAFKGWSGDNDALRNRLDRGRSPAWALPIGVKDIAPTSDGLLVITTNGNRHTHTWTAVASAAARIRRAP